MRVRFKSLLLAGVLAIAVACTDSTRPGDNGGPVPQDSLTILRLAEGSPQPETDSVSFYAVYGQNREGTIQFVGGEDFLTFKVDDFSLFKDPNGNLYGPGDSVLITIKMVGTDSFYFAFSPHGIVFNPLRPAELKLEYGHAGETVEGDLNGDGLVNSQDDTLETELHIWIQESPGGTFTPLSVLTEFDLNEIEAEIPGFSRFALAY